MCISFEHHLPCASSWLVPFLCAVATRPLCWCSELLIVFFCQEVICVLSCGVVAVRCRQGIAAVKTAAWGLRAPADASADVAVDIAPTAATHISAPGGETGAGEAPPAHRPVTARPRPVSPLASIQAWRPAIAIVSMQMLVASLLLVTFIFYVRSLPSPLSSLLLRRNPCSRSPGHCRFHPSQAQLTPADIKHITPSRHSCLPCSPCKP